MVVFCLFFLCVCVDGIMCIFVNILLVMYV